MNSRSAFEGAKKRRTKSAAFGTSSRTAVSAPAPVPSIQRHHLGATSVAPSGLPATGVIQKVNGPEKEARRKALQKQANDAIKRVRDRVKKARKRDGQEGFNAGENWLGGEMVYETEGGTDNPVEIDLGNAADGFRIIDIVPLADVSNSGLAKMRYKHDGYGNILVHIVPMKR